ncbi:HAD-IA family hydrolase [Amycolatopsis viridis]|uniref:Sugar-phosphatase n=1 Tax=Amycolatopsis viridis TaxID=185678 RepID=A0ABX0SSK7_9PSEU|nr:HAD-IA family hydrolase [Amycolatopsis viridis]NIH78892.1 sugar-phosphatase [Amycolatopsis viridis]
MSGRAALFDMDGTLVDSTEVVETLWTEFGARHGIEPARILSYAHGRQSRDIVARFLPETSVDAATAALLEEELNRLEEIKPVPGAPEFLRRVAAQVPVAIVTSAPRRLAEARMAAAGVPIPDVLISGDDVRTGKPAPEGYLLAARRLRIAAAACLAFEDAEAGLAAAMTAGAFTVVVGDHESPRANALPRLPDFTNVSVSGSAGAVTISSTRDAPVTRREPRRP